ncbi:hypothetical protein [Desulfosarcina cetonica]|uniref:hypothetical protein n=1 Tax=Desulfosarcina cetonica TaxID=90730 RepID=UPI0006CF792D|nr:hypothetical protein [Desulfosarcina cetonica]
MTEKKANAPRQPKAWGRYLLVFFLAAWMFVLGVLVGRGTAPVTFDIRALEKELLLLRKAAMHEEREQMKEALGGEVEFYERLPSDAPESTDAIPPLPKPPTVDRADKSPTDTTTQTPPHRPVPRSWPKKQNGRG